MGEFCLLLSTSQKQNPRGSAPPNKWCEMFLRHLCLFIISMWILQLGSRVALCAFVYMLVNIANVWTYLQPAYGLPMTCGLFMNVKFCPASCFHVCTEERMQIRAANNDFHLSENVKRLWKTHITISQSPTWWLHISVFVKNWHLFVLVKSNFGLI